MPRPRRISAPYRRFLAVVSAHPWLTRALMRLAAHVDPILLKATNGRAALPLGFPVLLLRTTGRRSGLPRESALLFTADGGRIVLVASHAGGPAHPGWYHNLVADPRCEVLTDGRSGVYRARVVHGDERARLWRLATARYRGYDVYQGRAGREIPVVALERDDGTTPAQSAPGSQKTVTGVPIRTKS